MDADFSILASQKIEQPHIFSECTAVLLVCLINGLIGVHQPQLLPRDLLHILLRLHVLALLLNVLGSVLLRFNVRFQRSFPGLITLRPGLETRSLHEHDAEENTDRKKHQEARPAAARGFLSLSLCHLFYPLHPYSYILSL